MSRFASSQSDIEFLTGALSLHQLLDAVERKLDGMADTCADNASQEALQNSARKFAITRNHLLKMVRDTNNPAQLINKLPCEVLTLIFVRVQQHHTTIFPPPQGGEDMTGAYKWLVVTHVCQHWRRIALQTPSLWNKIVMGPELEDYEGLHKWYLKHAGSSTLLSWDFHAAQRHYRRIIDPFDPRRIYVHTQRRKPTKAFFDIFEVHLHRMTSLVIRANVDVITDYNDALVDSWNAHKPEASFMAKELSDIICNNDIPALETLHLSFPNFSRVKRHLSPPSSVMSAIANGCTPYIKRLSLGLVCSWPGNHFAALTHLYLHHQEKTKRPSITAFLDFIEASPALEELWLQDAGPIVTADNVPTVKKVLDFPRLNHIRIGWSHDVNAKCYLWMLGHIRGSKDVMISLCAVNFFAEVVAFRTPEAIAMKTYLAPYLALITSIEIIHGPGHMQTCAGAAILHGSKLLLNASLFRKSMLMGFATEGPLTNVKTMTLKYLEERADYINDKPMLPFCRDELVTLLTPFTRLQRLEVHWPEYAHRNITEALGSMQDQTYAHSTKVVICPHLKELVMSDSGTILHTAAFIQDFRREQKPPRKFDRAISRKIPYAMTTNAYIESPTQKLGETSIQWAMHGDSTPCLLNGYTICSGFHTPCNKGHGLDLSDSESEY